MTDELALHQQVMNEHGYDYVRKIASGGFASIHLVHSRRYNQDFAVKISDLTRKDGDLNLNEIDTLAKLAHPRIIKLYEYFRHQQFLYLVLEYCERGSLDDLMKNQKLPIRQALALFHDVVSAVAACHEAGIAHRDIKPANVLIDCYGHAKLADFGLGVTSKHDVRVESNGCSIAFSPPEYFKHRAIEPFKADVWSLGVLLYYMVEGTLPWNMGHGKIQQQIQEGIQHIHQTIPFSVRKLILRMAAVDPYNRITACEARDLPLLQQASDKSRLSLYGGLSTGQEAGLAVVARRVRSSQNKVGNELIKSFEMITLDTTAKRKAKAHSGRLMTFNPLAAIPEEPENAGSARVD